MGQVLGEACLFFGLPSFPGDPVRAPRLRDLSARGLPATVAAARAGRAAGVAGRKRAKRSAEIGMKRNNVQRQRSMGILEDDGHDFDRIKRYVI